MNKILNNEPLVSVIIPTYNRAHLIEETITSVVNQTYKNLEIIIVDDGSTDDTENVIEKLKYEKLFYYKLNDNAGAPKARNVGVEKSNGEFIAFLDSDDLWDPNKTIKQMQLLLSSDSDVGAVYCGIKIIDIHTKVESGRAIILKNLYENFSQGKYFLTPTTGALIFRKNAFLSIEGFDEKLPGHQDTELAIRFCQKFKYEFVEEYLITQRRNHEQIMGNPINHIIGKEIILKKHSGFLSKDIKFSISKQIANYYILSRNHLKAKSYIYKSLKMKPYKIVTIIQYLTIIIAPDFLYRTYWKKYSEIPYTSGLNPKK